MSKSPKNITDVYNQLVGEEGIKSEIKLEIDNPTLRRVGLHLLTVGILISVTAHLLRPVFRSKDLAKIRGDVEEIKAKLA